MKQLEANLITSLQAARDGGIAPAHFFWVEARNRDTGAPETMGLWTGDEDITVNVRTPSGGLTSRAYIGGCNLSVTGIQYVADLTDNPITVSMSQTADATQQLVRGYEPRIAYCEVHATTWNGGALTSNPDLEWIGIIDGEQISTPPVGADGQIALTVRSELMWQLTAVNPAKSSNAHQKRRSSTDRFSEYSGVVKDWVRSWFKP